MVRLVATDISSFGHYSIKFKSQMLASKNSKIYSCFQLKQLNNIGLHAKKRNPDTKQTVLNHKLHKLHINYITT